MADMEFRTAADTRNEATSLIFGAHVRELCTSFRPTPKQLDSLMPSYIDGLGNQRW